MHRGEGEGRGEKNDRKTNNMAAICPTMGCDAGAFRGVAWVDGWMDGREMDREREYIVARLLLLLTADAMPTERLSYLLLRGWLLMLCDEQLLGFYTQERG